MNSWQNSNDVKVWCLFKSKRTMNSVCSYVHGHVRFAFAVHTVGVLWLQTKWKMHTLSELCAELSKANPDAGKCHQQGLKASNFLSIYSPCLYVQFCIRNGWSKSKTFFTLALRMFLLGFFFLIKWVSTIFWKIQTIEINEDVQK